jgi:hypothetical protein
VKGKMTCLMGFDVYVYSSFCMVMCQVGAETDQILINIYINVWWL